MPCPTQAFVEPLSWIARNGISYLTIELRGSHSEGPRALGYQFSVATSVRTFAPWNRRARDCHDTPVSS